MIWFQTFQYNITNKILFHVLAYQDSSIHTYDIIYNPPLSLIAEED